MQNYPTEIVVRMTVSADSQEEANAYAASFTHSAVLAQYSEGYDSSFFSEETGVDEIVEVKSCK